MPAPGFEARTSVAGSTATSESTSVPSGVPCQRRQPPTASTIPSGSTSAAA
ncbi:MAG: hypothetical protein IPH86_06365 [bacterium]|nr:hypothetical protein [bacterium]